MTVNDIISSLQLIDIIFYEKRKGETKERKKTFFKNVKWGGSDVASGYNSVFDKIHTHIIP